MATKPINPSAAKGADVKKRCTNLDWGVGATTIPMDGATISKIQEYPKRAATKNDKEKSTAFKIKMQRI
jgi:hypothetical protein